MVSSGGNYRKDQTVYSKSCSQSERKIFLEKKNISIQRRCELVKATDYFHLFDVNQQTKELGPLASHAVSKSMNFCSTEIMLP